MTAANTDGACITFSWPGDVQPSAPDGAQSATVGEYPAWTRQAGGGPT